MTTQRAFLPAAGLESLLPLYDLITKLTGSDRVREELLGRVPLQPGERVLDLGSGTGTLVVLLKQRHPAVEVTGVDPDPKAIARAERKAHRRGVEVRFDQGFADALPYAAGSFDHVFSSFMFHHLEEEQKEPALREVRRVLKPGGKFHLLDFSGPDEGGGHGHLARMFHSHARVRSNTADLLGQRMDAAGLRQPELLARRGLMYGLAHAVYYRATAPA